MASPIPITVLSAAFTLVDWISAHGREPTCAECSGGNGLLFYHTYRRKLDGDSFSAMLRHAHMLVSAALASAVSARLQTCLGPDCAVRFAYTGYHFCPACRAALGHDNEDGVNGNGRYLAAHDKESAQRSTPYEPAVTRAELRRIGLDRIGREIGILEDDWLIDDNAVLGFDDEVAQSMLREGRRRTLSTRKRRFFREP